MLSVLKRHEKIMSNMVWLWLVVSEEDSLKRENKRSIEQEEGNEKRRFPNQKN